MREQARRLFSMRLLSRLEQARVYNLSGNTTEAARCPVQAATYTSVVATGRRRRAAKPSMATPANAST